MRYLWTDYDENIFYRTDSAEILIEEMGTREPKERGGKISDSVGINPLVRFGAILDPLLKAKKDTAETENILYHFLAHIDELCGKNKDSFVEELIAEEIAADGYGRRAGEIFRSLPRRARRVVAFALRKQEAAKGRESAYIVAVRSLFPKIKIYFYHDEEKFLLVLPYNETAENRAVLELCEILFLAMEGNRPEYFWQESFGAVELSDTMRIGNIVVY